MTYRIRFAAIAIALAAIAIAALSPSAPLWLIPALSVASLCLLTGCYKSVRTPLQAVENGIYLLREQDFSSNLCPTGQRDADKVVHLFNSLMNSMKAERLKLQEQHYLLHKLIQASPTGIAICDFDARITMTNKAFDSLTDQSLLQTLRELRVSESRVVRDSLGRILRCSAHLFMDSGFSRRFFLVELMTEEIIKAERSVMERVIRSIGHEVNNTLGSVITLLDTLSAIHAGEPSTHATLESCSESCMRLAQFIRRYAEVVKLPPPRLAPIPLAQEIAQMLPFLQTIAGPEIPISFSAPADAANVMADAMLLERVMANAVKNAAESIASAPTTSTTSPRIDITVNGREVTITDNGPGITPATAARLFTPFFSTKHTDRGLGLMLIADILRSHSATYSLSTSPTTHLTSFRFSLP